MKNFLSFLFLFLNVIFLSGQENPSTVSKDFQVWSALDFKIDLSKEFEFSFKQALRTKNNSQELKNYFSELSLKRKLVGDLEFTARLRMIELGTNSAFRITNHLDYKHRLKPFDIGLRTRFDFNLDDNTNWRNRITIAFRKKKIDWRPSIGLEFTNSSEFDFSLITRIRAFARMKYKINKTIGATLGYIVQEDFNLNNPDRDYIVNIAIGIDLGRLGKSKKKNKEAEKEEF